MAWPSLVPTSCQSLPSHAFSSRSLRLRQGAQHPPLGAPAPFPHALLARNGVCHTVGVAAVVPANGTQSDKLDIASPQPIFSLDPYHEHPDGRCMPHVTGTICHIACTTTPGPVHSPLSQRPCPAPSFQTLRPQLPFLPGKSSAT